MLKLMQNRPLLVTNILRYASVAHREQTITTLTVEGPTHTYTYGDCYRRAQQVTLALQRLGVNYALLPDLAQCPNVCSPPETGRPDWQTTAYL